MRRKPNYFEPIRLGAAKRWRQLESDPELAGPWHQLFKQVQSPRHVLSELLQNADDAGATEASVRIEDGVFIFQHNGEDFSEEHLRSLCRFGYSNKRALHTIGFRGIGFKSTFSLGDSVDLLTPSLAIRFDRKRFTEPLWLGESVGTTGATQVRVRLADLHRQGELEKNLEDWLKSPVSLLFFRHIRRLQVGDQTVHWGSLGPGPAPGSEWMALHGEAADEVLVVRSAEAAFPEEALEEIKQERTLSPGEDTEFPPCRVEIVMGTKGRLFVVLPTGVETKLPFACNAPFVQDPARLKIKDPETSPTNRWLLERVGRLAASAMLSWLEDEALSADERAGAYGLLPDVDRDEGSLEGVCGTKVELAFSAAISDRPLLISEAGELSLANESVIVPEAMVEVWPAQQASGLFDEKGRPPLSQQVVAADRKKLLNWKLVEEITKAQILATLQTKNLPKPRTWGQLCRLWSYVAPAITGFPKSAQPENVRIHPVQGSSLLFSALGVVRMGERRVLHSPSDWDFLAPHLRIVDPEWLSYLAAEKEGAAKADPGPEKKKALEATLVVMKETGLDGATDVNRIVSQFAASFSASGERSLSDHVRLAQIAAKFGGKVPARFQYCTEDEVPRPADAGIVWDKDGVFLARISTSWASQHLLHGDYSSSFVSCTSEEWRDWASSDRSLLHLLPPLEAKHSPCASEKGSEAVLRKLGYSGSYAYPYVTGRGYSYQRYAVIDFDFPAALIEYSEEHPEDDDLWKELFRLTLCASLRFWKGKDKVRATQTSSNGQSTLDVGIDVFPAAWVRRLSGRAVLRDTHGNFRPPAELLRRTPATEPLLGLEAFVEAAVDLEEARPLLDLLGVRSTPPGPDRLVECLRALSRSPAPPVLEVDKWYRRLDEMFSSLSFGTLVEVIKTFKSERLILNRDGRWVSVAGTFLSADASDAPGVSVIRTSVAELPMWRKVGVAERPTPDLAIAWLKSLPSDQALSQEDLSRVRVLLGRYPIQTWQACEHWLNLEGHWVPVRQLSYALTMQGLIPWKHLFPSVKQKTADLQNISAEVASGAPFAHLKALNRQLEERVEVSALSSGRPEKKPWLEALGGELSRASFESEEESQRVQALASRLAKTVWLQTKGLMATPCIDGTPAGAPRQADVLWSGLNLLVDGASSAKLARRVPEELGKVFDRADIRGALAYSFERSVGDVCAYLEENFKLAEKIAPAGEELGEEDGEGTQPTEGGTKGGSADNATGEAGPDQEEKPDDDKANEQDLEDEVEGELDDGNQQEGSDREDETGRRPPVAAKPSLIERFARARGFRWNGEKRLVHPDGRWLSRSSDIPSIWECRSGSGTLVRCYWFKDHCFGRGAVEIGAEIWGLIEQQRETHSIVLSDPQGEPVEVTGARIRALQEAGDLALFPASYRLVFEEG